MEPNQIDTYLDALQREMRKAYEEVVPKLQGGATPPRSESTPEAEQLAAYVLLAQDPAELPPDEQQRWMQAREQTIAGRTREELAEVVVSMNRLLAEVTGQRGVE